MRACTMDDSLAIEAELPAPVGRAWAALTSPAAVAAWWGGHVRLEPRPGGRLHERWTDERGRAVVTTGVVTRLEPPTLLEMTWSDDDRPGETRVAFALEERAGGRSLLRLEHRGWDALPAVGRRELIEAHAAGWRRHVRSLCEHLGR